MDNPHISEYVYSNFSENSVHLSEWPKTDRKKINENLEAIFGQTLQIIEKGLAERDKVQAGLKWPLAKATIFVKGSERFEKVVELIKTQLNVKEIKFKSPASKDTELVVELDSKKNPELEAEGYARELSRKIQEFRKNLGLNKKDLIKTFIFTDGDFAKIIELQKDFLKERTNSGDLKIVTTAEKENFKNTTDFKIKDKRGIIGIITTNK